jgi:TetR/AcrR family transcriptional regulator
MVGMSHAAPGRPRAGAADQPSRERLLAAALEEFAAHGPAGARVDAIGRRAGLNKQLITYYFGGKEGLYREMLRWCFGQPSDLPESGPVPDLLVEFFRGVLANPQYSRLLQWEALGGEPVDDDSRTERFRSMVAAVTAEQAAGRLPADMDADLLLLTLIAAAEYPVAHPQITRMVAGSTPSDPGFAQRYAAHLRRLADRLAPTTSGETAGGHPGPGTRPPSARRPGA